MKKIFMFCLAGALATAAASCDAVSYTHLTLPTKLEV